MDRIFKVLASIRDNDVVAVDSLMIEAKKGEAYRI